MAVSAPGETGAGRPSGDDRASELAGLSDQRRDRWSLAHSLNAFFAHHDALEDPLLLYVQAAEALFLGMLMLVVALARGERWATVRRAAVAAGLSAGAALLIGKIITEFLRPGPAVRRASGEIHLFAGHVADASFPSDHATASIAIARRSCFEPSSAGGAVTLVFALILMFGRVAPGFHYPSDVIGGALIGALAALALWTPPIRTRIDAITDRAGRAWDGGLDVILKLRRGSARASAP